MLTVFENTVTADEIAYLQQQFAQFKNTLKFEEAYFITNSDVLHDLYNSQASRLVQQERVDIRSHPVADVIRNIVNRILPNSLKPDIRILFSRSVYPVGIHTDTSEQERTGHTIMIPLTFDDRIKTLTWKETAIGEKELNSIFHQFQTNIRSFTRRSKISRELDLRNCWLSQPSIVDFLELDGIAEWRAGSIFKFERKQLHASNNYKAFVDFKDYVLIHNDE